MPPKKKKMITADKAQSNKKTVKRVPGEEGRAGRPRKAGRTQFSYELDYEVGMNFKLWCHKNGYYAKDVLQELIEDFLEDKDI